jgi:hypothetical protein
VRVAAEKRRKKDVFDCAPFDFSCSKKETKGSSFTDHLHNENMFGTCLKKNFDHCLSGALL